MPGPQRVSGLDASFLSLETAIQPLQVFSVIELNPETIPGGYDYQHLRDRIAERVGAVPELREKLSCGVLDLDHPVWVEDADFDIDRHVHRISLQSPGGRQEFTEACSRLAGLPLDRRHPLWEIWVIEGLDSGPDCERLAVFVKAHHAAADGVTFARLLSALCSDESNPQTPAPVHASPDVGWRREAVTGLVRFLSRPLYFATKVLPAALRAIIDATRRARNSATMAAPFSAPCTPLNKAFTAERNVAFARLDLNDVKRVKNHFDVKVNDVVTTLVAGVVRKYLLDRAALPVASLVALEPVSVHGLSDRTARNQVSGMLVKLRTDIADPAERLRSIATLNSLAKDQVAAISPTLLQDFGEVVGSVLLGIAKRIYGRLTLVRPMYNVIVSNVPGPSPARYFVGAEVVAMYPCGPILLGGGLNFTFWSVNGRIHIGVISCPRVVPELSDLAKGLEAGLADLLREVDGVPKASAVV